MLLHRCSQRAAAQVCQYWTPVVYSHRFYSRSRHVSRSFSSLSTDQKHEKKENRAVAIEALPWRSQSLERLLELSKPEWPLIALSASTLLVTSSVTLLLPFASGYVIDYTAQQAAEQSSAVTPLVLSSGLFGLTTLTGAGVYLRTLWLARAGNRIVARLRQKLYQAMLRQEAAWMDQSTSTGDLFSRLSADSQLVQGALTTQAIAALRGSLMSLGAATMLVWTSPTLAAISVGTLPPIFIASRQLGRRLAKQQEHVQELLGDATSLAEEALTSVRTVQQFVAEDFETNRYRNAIAQAHEMAVETAKLQAQLEAAAHVAGNATMLGVLGYGGSMVLEGSISAGDLTGFVMYSLLLAGNLSGLTSTYSDMVRAVAASNRIFEIVDRTPQIPSADAISDDLDTDPLVVVDYAPLTQGDSNKEEGIMGPAPLIEIDNLTFSYPSRPDIPVLKALSLRIEPGEVLALVGGSGSGKSTIASLLTRIYDSSSGQILLDGKPIVDFEPRHLRQMVGIVSQDPVLLRGSIRDNIRYGSWNKLTDERIEQAARKAHVLDFANSFTEGLDTQVGPRGAQLSGGQRQRIALARVLAKDAPIIILDEATSALDAQSEHLVQQALQSLFEESGRGRTIISIAHRLSTIRHSTRIAVVQDGTIIQTGAFDDLRSMDGPFRNLMKTQLVGDI